MRICRRWPAMGACCAASCVRNGGAVPVPVDTALAFSSRCTLLQFFILSSFVARRCVCRLWRAKTTVTRAQNYSHASQKLQSREQVSGQHTLANNQERTLCGLAPCSAGGARAGPKTTVEQAQIIQSREPKTKTTDGRAQNCRSASSTTALAQADTLRCIQRLCVSPRLRHALLTLAWDHNTWNHNTERAFQRAAGG